MALVAYDNSDCSEYEDDDNDSAPVVILNKKLQTNTNVVEPSATQPQVNDDKPATEGPSLFNLLPSKNKKTAVIEEDDEFLHKKETPSNVPKPKAKITVPSLSEFRDVEDKPMARPKATNGKKSGLLSMLPQPKNAGMSSTTSLIPNVLTKKPSAPLVPNSVKKKTPLPSPIKKPKANNNELINYSDESDNDDEETTDFFSINKPIEIAPDNGPLDIDLESAKSAPKKPGIESFFKKDVELKPDYIESNDREIHNDNLSEYSEGGESSSYSGGYSEPQTSTSDAVLDDEAIRQLIGSRAKRKKEDIQIVDVNQQEVLGDSREWLLKGLMDDTTKRVSSSKKSGNEPSAQQRRKHQITYLAHQAKANEAELQNQWANNRLSKRKTQSKYGF